VPGFCYNSIMSFRSIEILPLKGLGIFNVYSHQDYSYFFRESKFKVFSIRKEKIKFQGKEVISYSTILYSKKINKLLLLPSFLLFFENKWFYPEYLYSWFDILKKYFIKVIRKYDDLSLNEVKFFYVLDSLEWIKEDYKKLDRFYLCLNDIPTAIHHLRRYHFLYSKLRNMNLDLILEVGPGMGYFVNKFSRYNYYFYEIDEKSCSFISYLDLYGRARFVDIYDSPTLKFPFIFFLEVLEHVRDPFAFWGVISSLLTGNGHLCFSVPDENFGGSHLNPEHLTNWNLNRIQKFISCLLDFKKIDYFFQERFDFVSDNWIENSKILENYPDSKEVESYFVLISNFVRKKAPKVLIVKRTAALGDVLLIEPVVRTLKSKFPDALLVLLTKYTELFKSNPDIDILMKYSEYGSKIPSFSVSKRKIINLDFAYEKSPNLSILEAYKRTANLDYINGVIPRVYLSYSDLLFLRHIFRNFKESIGNFFVVINIGRKFRRDRTLPPDFVYSMVRFFVEQGYTNSVFFVGSPDNFSPSEYKIDFPYIDLVGMTNVLQVAAILSIADLLIAPDTGLIHLASAVGCNSIGVFGMADPQKRVDYASGLVYSIFPDIPCRGCLHKKFTIDPKCDKEFELFPECMLLSSNIDKAISLSRSILDGKIPNLWESKLKLLCNEEF